VVGHGAKFGRKRDEAVVALLSQRTIEDVARTVNVSTSTLLRWLKEPEFEAAYREARRCAFGQAVARLQQASSAAASTILTLMVDPSAPPAVRLRAAECALDRG
jgi:transposase-like protein